MPRVSIVIPVHNQPALVHDAVASLQAQSLRDWEAVLVDDGSTDQTPGVLQRLAAQDARISVLSQSQSGAAAARNSGAARTRSEWLLFLDSDDWLAPEALGSLLRSARRDVELVHGLGLRVCGGHRQDRSQVQLPRGDLFHRLASTATFMVHACILRKATFHELGGFDETLMGCADWDLWQRVVRSGARCHGVDEIVAFYRQTDASLSTQYGQEFRDGLIVIARGHGRDPRVPKPVPAYAEGVPISEYSAAAYRFASWLAGLAIARQHPIEDILKRMRALPPERLSASDVGAALFDAIPIGLGDFRPDWESRWPELQPPLHGYLAELAAIADCGSSFATDALHEIERLAATANASDLTRVVGSVASRIVRIPGSIPDVSEAPGVTSFIAVACSDRADLGVVEVPVGQNLPAERLRETLIARFPRSVATAYLRRFPFSMLFGTIRHALRRRQTVMLLARSSKGPERRDLMKELIRQALLEQSFILPVGRSDGPTRKRKIGSPADRGFSRPR